MGGRKVPAIFGMNFQSVSVAQKLVDSYSQPGGYQPGTFAFTPQMEDALGYVDEAIGSMVAELRQRGLLKSTALIISAKHGQSPIDPSKLHKIGDPISTILTAAGVTIAQSTEDDIALLWLKDQSQTATAVAALEADQRGLNTARIQSILSGDGLADRFGNPRHDRSTPDIIVQPIVGTIYTRSTAKWSIRQVPTRRWARRRGQHSGEGDADVVGPRRTGVCARSSTPSPRPRLAPLRPRSGSDGP
jgi:hypothetical protein